MLGTDDNRHHDEILSNNSSPCGSDSPTCFIRQSTFKTKETFTQYPCLGKIYADHFLNFFIIHLIWYYVYFLNIYF